MLNSHHGVADLGHRQPSTKLLKEGVLFVFIKNHLQGDYN